MRILHCILSKEYAGSEAYMCQLAKMQAEAGHEVRVLVKEPPPPRLWRPSTGLAYLTRIVRECGAAPVAHIPGWWPSFLDQWAIRGVMNGFEPEIVHTHLGRAAKRAGAAARGRGVKHVSTLHLDWRKDYALCDGVICIANWQRKNIPAGYAGKVAVVWNWIGGKPAKAVPQAGVVRFGSVGRLVPNKGMDVLVKAFRRAFPKGNEKVSLTLVGEGPQQVDLLALTGGDKRIVFTGFRDDVAALYPAFDVYVSAARYEPFGLTILEAMQAGCRLVCTRTKGPVEFLKDTKVAWAKPGDAATLADALRAAAKGKGRVPWGMAPFSPGRALKEIFAFYKSVL